jgi:hypothetical protein
MANSQVGFQLYTKTPPVFTGYTVRGGTWEETDSTQTENMRNQNEEEFNTTAWNRGLNAKCDLFTNAGTNPSTPPIVLDVISEVTPSTRKWLVLTVNKKNFGKRSLVFSVDLQQRDAQDLSITS